MASQISYIKLMKRDVRTRGWVPLLTTILLIVVFPVTTLFQVESKMSWMTNELGEFARTDLAWWFREFIGTGNGPVAAVVILSAFLIGVTGFSYLHSVEKMDFFYALPVRRSQMLAAYYANGVMMFVIPYLITYWGAVLVGVRYQIHFDGEILWYVRTVVVTILYFLLFYTLTVLAMFLTGKLLAGIALAVGFFVYGKLLAFVVQQLSVKYFDTYFAGMNKDAVFSPVGSYIEEVQLTNFSEMPGIGKYAVLLGCVVLLYAALFVCARFRPSEAAESALAFRKMEGIVKVAVTVPGALACGLVAFINGSRNHTWFVLICLAAAIVISFMIAFSYHMDPKEFYKIRGTTVLSLVLVGVCIAAFYYDVPGYDSYFPKETQVKKIAVRFDNIVNYYSGVPSGCAEVEKRQLESLFVSTNEELYEELQKVVKENVPMSERGQAGAVVSVIYSLGNGRNVYRSYYGDYEKTKAFAKKMLNQKEYAEKVCSLDSVLQCRLNNGMLKDLKSYERPLGLSEKQLKELFKLYEKDLQESKLTQLTQEHIVGGITAECSVPAAQVSYMVDNFTIYDSFKHVLSYLEEAGFEMNEGYVPEEILSITVEDYREEEGAAQYVTITDPEQIKKIFPYLRKYEFGTFWYESEENTSGLLLNVVWKDGNTSSHELSEGGEELL